MTTIRSFFDDLVADIEHYDERKETLISKEAVENFDSENFNAICEGKMCYRNEFRASDRMNKVN